MKRTRRTWGRFRLLMPGAGWGVRGAAAATAVSYVAGGVAMFLAMMHNRKVSPRGIPLRLDKRIMGDCVRIGRAGRAFARGRVPGAGRLLLAG